MNFTSKFDLGQIVEFTSNNSVKSGKILSVCFEAEEIYYEIDEQGFVLESKITAIFTRTPVVTQQLNLPLETEYDGYKAFDDEFVSGAV